jgi:benzil reductase ((S)-benzoin forming)
MTRNVLITGVSSGIGLGLLRESLRRGDRVFGLGRKSPPDVTGPNFRFVICDLADFASVPVALAESLRGADRIDLAILNAGILGGIADLSETPVNHLKSIMDINLWANKVLLDALFAGPWAVEQVVGISSGAAVSGARGWNGYALSKAALNMLMKLYAAERPGTHITALAPGLVDTAMQTYARALHKDPRFPTIDRLKQASGTPDMPTPDQAAPRLLDAMERLRGRKSGEFFDLRTLD